MIWAILAIAFGLPTLIWSAERFIHGAVFNAGHSAFHHYLLVCLSLDLVRLHLKSLCLFLQLSKVTEGLLWATHLAQKLPTLHW